MSNTFLEYVKLSECRVGDVIQTHGGRFRLAERTDVAGCHDHKGINGFRSFRTTFLGVCGSVYNLDTDETRPYCAVPEHWRNDYAIQSNDYAMWCREVSPVE